MSPDVPKLGLLAGGGNLPRQMIAACRKTGRSVFVVAFVDQCDPTTVEGVDHAWVRMGAAGKAIELLRANQVKHLVMAGHIHKPKMSQLLPDPRTLKFLFGGFLNKGDDGLLTAIIRTLEKDEGFTFVGVHDVMPELLAPEGVLGCILPDEEGTKSMCTAVQAALDLGAQDLGQAAVAQATHVVALEGRAGTDVLLQGLEGQAAAKGGVLAKMCKPGQERRADLPTIGIVTLEKAAAAGLKGVVVEAGASLIIDRIAVIAAADRLGLFLIGTKPGAFKS